MSSSEKTYTYLCVLFSLLIIIGNMVYQKFICLQLPFYKFELSAGAMLYPLTFLITDLIAEFYGKEKAKFCIRLAMLLNILVIIIILFIDSLPATKWSKIDNTQFHNVFGYYGIAFISSSIACYISETIDIRIYLLIRYWMKGKHLWLRSFGSTSISLFIDTIIVIGLMTIFGVLNYETMWLLIVDSYSWKLFFTIFSVPLFYLCVLIMKIVVNKT